MQVTIRPDVGQAQQSNMSSLQPFLIAGIPQQLALAARDAQGNPTANEDSIEVLLDSTAEGRPQGRSTQCT